MVILEVLRLFECEQVPRYMVGACSRTRDAVGVLQQWTGPSLVPI